MDYINLSADELNKMKEDPNILIYEPDKKAEKYEGLARKYKILSNLEMESKMHSGNMLYHNWFRDNKKSLYSVHDILQYAYSMYPVFERSVNHNADVEENICKQIRRVMPKIFELKKNKNGYVYYLDEAETIYLVNYSLKDYFDKYSYPEERKKFELDMLQLSLKLIDTYKGNKDEKGRD